MLWRNSHNRNFWLWWYFIIKIKNFTRTHKRTSHTRQFVMFCLFVFLWRKHVHILWRISADLTWKNAGSAKNKQEMCMNPMIANIKIDTEAPTLQPYFTCTWLLSAMPHPDNFMHQWVHRMVQHLLDTPLI